MVSEDAVLPLLALEDVSMITEEGDKGSSGMTDAQYGRWEVYPAVDEEETTEGALPMLAFSATSSPGS